MHQAGLRQDRGQVKLVLRISVLTCPLSELLIVIIPPIRVG